MVENENQDFLWFRVIRNKTALDMHACMSYKRDAMAKTATIRNLDTETWNKFRKILIDEIDPRTGHSYSANQKMKELIEEYVKKKESERQLRKTDPK